MKTKNFRAIAMTHSLARKLQVEIPEIAQDYAKLSAAKVAEKHDIAGQFNVSNVMAELAVLAALKGHTGKYGLPAYDGLLTREEFEQYRNAHYQQAVELSRQRKRQIYSRTTAQRREDGIKGGKSLYEQRKGVHKLSLEERSRLAKRSMEPTIEQHRANGAKSAMSRGQVPWDIIRNGISEIERAIQLSFEPKYLYGDKTNAKRIAETLNREYHGGTLIRTSNAVCSTLSLWRTGRRYAHIGKEYRKNL